MSSAIAEQIDQHEESGQLWERYAQSGSPELRDSLILQFQPLVRYVVRRLGFPSSGVLELGDLISYGTIGLIEAVERFEPERGTPFTAYAIARIRGSVLDALRAMDRLPRSLRRKAREADNAISVLTSELGRTPCEREIADALGVSLDMYREWAAVASRVTVSLDALSHPSGEDDRAEIGVADTDAPTLDHGIEREESRRELARAIAQLPRRDQLLLCLYYKDGLNMREVGEVLGVTESRVSQLCSRALSRLEQVLTRDLAAA